MNPIFFYSKFAVIQFYSSKLWYTWATFTTKVLHIARIRFPIPFEYHIHFDRFSIRIISISQNHLNAALCIWWHWVAKRAHTKPTSFFSVAFVVFACIFGFRPNDSTYVHECCWIYGGARMSFLIEMNRIMCTVACGKYMAHHVNENMNFDRNVIVVSLNHTVNKTHTIARMFNANGMENFKWNHKLITDTHTRTHIKPYMGCIHTGFV